MATSSNTLKLEVVFSREIAKKSKSRAPSAHWHVDPTKPWIDDVNFGRLCMSLEITAPCELCHFSEGRPDKVINLKRTPDQDMYRKNMQVYLQHRAIAKTEEQKMAATFGINLTEEEMKILRLLKLKAMPNLNPDLPCPLCQRKELPVDMSEYSQQQSFNAGSPSRLQSQSGFGGPGSPSASMAGSPKTMSQYNLKSQGSMMMDGSMAGSPMGAAAGMQAPNFATARPAELKPEVGVQCGQASRMGEDDVTVNFGTGARFKEHSTALFDGPPVDFPHHKNANFDFSPTILDLKAQAEQFQRERDQVVMELREMTKQRNALDKWKQEHRCEVSAEVSKTKRELELMQGYLREMMRGREEVFAVLQQRRTEGSMYSTDTHRPYAPFALSLPSLDSAPTDPHKLLAKDTQTLRGKTGPGEAFELPRREGSEESQSGVEVMKRPSGAPDPNVVSGLGMRNEDAEDMLSTQVVGECMLRVASNSGDAFSVKRRVGSLLRSGRHVFTLSSLDGVITDEIHVEELETVSLQGSTGMHLATGRHQWQIHLNPAERQRWLHWMYALNPYLSATAAMSTGGIPNSY